MTVATMEAFHLIGIGGIGMSALAQILLQRGDKVTGSDHRDGAGIATLRELGAEIEIGHRTDQVPEGAVVVTSSAIAASNPELIEARARGCRIMHRSDLLNELCQGKRVIAVAGTHGKTSTSALLAHVLRTAGMDPSFAIGGITPSLGVHGHLGKDDLFVLEADESDGSFLKCQPYGAIVTNIDDDHMDFFKERSGLDLAFGKFLASVQCRDALFIWANDRRLSALSEGAVGFGYHGSGAIELRDYRQEGWEAVFTVSWNGRFYTDLRLPVPGVHQVQNAMGVLGMALRLGVSIEVVRLAFASFSGVQRRTQRIGEVSGVLVVDDYAHHPSAIKCTLDSLRKAYPDRRIICVIQPHRYTRTNHWIDRKDFPFIQVDDVLITDICPAGEQPIAGVSGESLARHMTLCKRTPVRFVSRDKLLAELEKTIRPLDLVVVMGAGDCTRLSYNLVESLKQKGPQKYRLGLIYGGESPENSVSLASARGILGFLNPEYFDVSGIAITRDGRWICDPKKELLQRRSLRRRPQVPRMPAAVLKELNSCDVLFPILHGPRGEDGTVQGFFELLGKPYVGCEATPSAICMDKGITKRLVTFSGMRTSPWVEVDYEDWRSHSRNVAEVIWEKLTLPMYVKPARLGSSIGVTRAETQDQLWDAIEKAWEHDHRIIVEQEVLGRQLEFAMKGFDEGQVTWPAEIIVKDGFYDYDAKYKGKAAQTHVRADLDPDLVIEGQILARRVYAALGCTGMARIDFFLDEDGHYWLNEVNPIPGFREASLYPRMWEAQGLKTENLLSRLIAASLRRHGQRQLCQQ